LHPSTASRICVTRAEEPQLPLSGSGRVGRGDGEAKLSFEPAKDVTATDDATVVSLVCLGDKERFAELVERHQRIVFRIVQGILNSPADSEEVLQEAFLKAYTHLREFRGQAQFRTWLIRIAINEARMRLRKYRPGLHDSIDESDPEGDQFEPRELRDWDPNPEERLESAEMSRLLERAIGALPRGYREIFLLRDVEQLSTEEAAESLEISVPAAKTRLRRARLMMREYLAPHFQKRWHQRLLDRVAGRRRTS